MSDRALILRMYKKLEKVELQKSYELSWWTNELNRQFSKAVNINHKYLERCSASSQFLNKAILKY